MRGVESLAARVDELVKEHAVGASDFGDLAKKLAKPRAYG